ncbi:hypothetical protein Dda_7854 [Drechslerella dactyloides]|uniref:Fido domain-containing protein n=1 Tax=Drechslerella dactyloides TaxID=74499 RepID=A0AAD6IRA9_DREDA|nr:hypothetical protein Dda_7854 [Drechslerella dactyloides]
MTSDLTAYPMRPNTLEYCFYTKLTMTDGKFPPSEEGPGTPKNIRDASPEIEVEASPSIQKASMSSTLRRLMGDSGHPAWPKWATLRRPGADAAAAGLPLEFNIKIQAGVMDYTKASSKEGTAEEVFADAANSIAAIRKATSEMAPASLGELQEELVDQMIRVVFGSNLVERAGLGLDETVTLCRTVFAGNWSDDLESPARPTEYHDGLEKLVQDAGELEGPRQTSLRDRREVINHAGALMYMISHVIDNNEPFSEGLIRNTHKILVRGVDVLHSDGKVTPSEQYAGFYRTVHVAAGDCNFVNPTFVPKNMKSFVEDLNRRLHAAEEQEELDPFYIAAHACSEFVNIHPFLDGNGRTCRLILNTILLKYAGILAPIGESEYQRTEYLDIARRRGEEECGSGELALYTLGKASAALRKLREKLHA